MMIMLVAGIHFVKSGNDYYHFIPFVFGCIGIIAGVRMMRTNKSITNNFFVHPVRALESEEINVNRSMTLLRYLAGKDKEGIFSVDTIKSDFSAFGKDEFDRCIQENVNNGLIKEIQANNEYYVGLTEKGALKGGGYVEGNEGEKLMRIFKFSLGAVFLTFLVAAVAMKMEFLGFTAPSGFSELGDSFGVLNALFSSLAFAFLIYTSLMQKRELQLQRAEFELTRLELERSAIAQSEIAKTSNKQLNLMKLNSKHKGVPEIEWDENIRQKNTREKPCFSFTSQQHISDVRFEVNNKEFKIILNRNSYDTISKGHEFNYYFELSPGFNFGQNYPRCLKMSFLVPSEEDKERYVQYITVINRSVVATDVVSEKSEVMTGLSMIG